MPRPKISAETKQEAVRRIQAKEATQREVAAELGVTPQAVSLWVNPPNKKPVGTGQRGRPKQVDLDAAQLKQLAQAMKQAPPDHGLERDQWDLGNAKELIDKLFGLKFSLGFVDKQLGLAGISLSSSEDDDDWSDVETDIDSIPWEKLSPDGMGIPQVGKLHGGSRSKKAKQKRKQSAKARKRNRRK